MLLSNINNKIKIKNIYNLDKDRRFLSISSNSKLINKHTIYIYDKNSKTKIKYLREAINKKTPAIISNKYFKFVKIPQFIVSNISTETTCLLKFLYIKNPYKTIAVTGTNGKTSVVWYISKILNLIKLDNATVGTLGYYQNGRKINNVHLTTPAYEELCKYGSSNKNTKKVFIFEASSHALAQNRLRNYPIDIAALTNISSDHLDYHKNISNYKKSKLKLFTKHLSDNGHAIINYRIKNVSNDIKNLKNKNINLSYFGNKFTFLERKNNFIKLIIDKKEYKLNKLKQRSDFELENLECAISCCLALKINKNKIINSLSKVTNPPGRLQKINYRSKRSKIIIDYAHTPDALKKILISLKSKNKLPVLVFGCGGERDKSKRKMMGIIAKKFASRVYVTDDNPRNENASSIRKDIIKFCPNSIEVSNRKKAIKKAIQDLNFNETLIIAGKGHEKFQIIKNKKLAFDDSKIVKDLIKL
tara:strand:- start:1585 stop:3006 length:1422 start_codon:yes stop_codon:yes gene_type:complete